MSNKIDFSKMTEMESKKDKFTLFNDFLKSLEAYKPENNSLDIDDRQNDLHRNKITFSKHTKIDGSKRFSLNTINSIITKDNSNKNSDKVKTIMDNLEFLYDNSKYINNIQHRQNLTNKNQNKNIISSVPQPQQNLFLIINNNNNNKSINSDYFHFSMNMNKNLNNTLSDEINYKNNNIKIEFDSLLNKENPQNINENINLLNKKIIIENNKNSGSSLYRQDYYVKQFKVQYSIWLRNYLNQKLKLLISETKNCRKHLKFYPLNSLKFTANPKYEDNKKFLSLKIKDILTFGIDSQKSSNQKKNKENIDIIENIIYKQHSNANPDLLNFLNKTMEDSIEIFYQSQQFQNFKNNEKVKINDLKFQEEKKFSLLENNGFVCLIKNYKGNSKSAI